MGDKLMNKQSESFLGRAKKNIINIEKKSWQLTNEEKENYNRETENRLSFMTNKVFLKNESIKGYLGRLYVRYDELVGDISDEEAMRIAKEETECYNNDPNFLKEVQYIIGQSVEEIEERMGLRLHDEK